MSQNGITLPTSGTLAGLTLVQDINLAHDTLASCFSGPSAPSTPVANQFWADTTNLLLKQRNSANSAWVTRGALDVDFFGLLPASYFRPHAAATPNMTVLIDAGKLQNATTKVSIAQQTTTTFTAPSVNPRNDLIVIDQSTGVYSIVAGTEAASPSDPAIPAGKIAIARVRLTVGIASITDAVIDDLRPGFYVPDLSSSASSILFDKLDAFFPAFIKTAAGTLSVKAGTSAVVAGVRVSWAADTAITMPALTAGNDYAIYVCTDGTIRADVNWSAPTGYTTANSRKIGGFHYGLVAAGTTVAGGSFATTGNGMIWTQGDVDSIAGINKFSIWDLKFRPACSDPRGMALINGRTWVDIYLCSTDTAANGTSKAGTNIASGTVLPKIPAAFGGNGTTTYPSLNWWVANELARANQKRMMWEHEFVDAAFGVTENQSIDATASTYPTTQRNAGYTSKYGIEQASGHHYTWGQDAGQYYDTATWVWKQVTGNTGAAGSERGQIYTEGTYGLTRVLLGGARAGGASSGSRCSLWIDYPWNSLWNFGLRAACDHLISA